MALGIALLIAGAALLVAEAHLPSAGALGVPGVGALVGGTALTIGAAGGGVALALPVALAAALAAGAFLLIATRKTAEAHRRQVEGGADALVGRLGVVRSAPAPEGQVFVDGALWRARRALDWDENGSLEEGDRVVVETVDGLTLCVRKAEEWELSR